MRVAIIGGGIVGLASAYYLSRRDVDVTVFEKSNVGSGNTERSAGGIRAQFSAPENIRLSQESIEVWEQFESEFGDEIDYRRTGYLFVARDQETAKQLEKAVEIQNEFGVDSEFLTPEAAMEKCPRLYSDAIVGASYCATDGHADPHLALQGFLGAAQEAGAHVRTGTNVTGVITEESSPARITGLETPDGRFEADYVVNAAGAWADQVAEMAGISLPISPKRIQIAIVDPVERLPETAPMTMDPVRECYFRPERQGQALIGGGTSLGDYDPDADPDFFSKKLDFDYAADALSRVSELAGYFGPESSIIGGWAGLYALTPDHSPIIEESLPGLVTAAGMSGHGFMHSPAVGKLVTELIVDGEASKIDISRLNRHRFDAEDEAIKDLVI